ncbi:MAG: hypothetical protein JOZ56_10035 [Actinobacteria bacterium]|nr:hypothetical protein [Actinomycetota bacterium]MBV8563417.1 hypothetical protein [Actinomycetota bacterium]
MARLGKLRPGPIGLAIAAWDVWRRLSPGQREQVLKLARQHGPKVARLVANSRRRGR